MASAQLICRDENARPPVVLVPRLAVVDMPGFSELLVKRPGGLFPRNQAPFSCPASGLLPQNTSPRYPIGGMPLNAGQSDVCSIATSGPPEDAHDSEGSRHFTGARFGTL
jgi:hypothetical protein